MWAIDLDGTSDAEAAGDGAGADAVLESGDGEEVIDSEEAGDMVARAQKR